MIATAGCVPPPPPARASAPSAAVTTPAALDGELATYERLRLALAKGSLPDARREARLLAITTSSGSSLVKRDGWGLSRADAAELAMLLRQVSAAMKRLANAPDLPSARDAFADATVPLVRWLRKAPHPSLREVWCDALHRGWI